jgi:choline dehydrogenase-like flavoprotein
MNANSQFDSIVIGSGAGGSAAAYQLARAGLRVAIVEKGGALPRDSSTLDFDKVVHQAAFKSKELWQDGRGRSLVPEEYFNVGGKTKWYGAALLRYSPHEFDADPAHQCLAWPFGYTEIAPWYEEAEKLLDVRTFEVERDLQSILARLHQSGAWRAEALKLGLSPFILMNLMEARRFDGFASPTDLKSDGETVFLSKLAKLNNVTLLTGSTVVDLLGDSASPRRITGVRLANGRRLRASTVLLAAGALHSPRLLSRYLENSGLDAVLPNARHVGRNLKLHLLTALIALSPSVKTDLIRKTAVLLNEALSHSSVQPLGFDGELISTLMPKVLPRALARHLGNRAYGFFLQTEDGSHEDNRVMDAETSARSTPVLDYEADRIPAAALEHRRLISSFKLALAKAGMISFSQRIGLAGTAHVCGTLVTGNDPASSVVDPFGQVHGMQSLYVVDGSVLPRSSRVNPSLTIYSWGLRVAQALAMELLSTQATRQAVQA